MIYIVSRSTEHHNFPKYSEKYRIEDYFSCMVIKPYTEMDKPGLEFSLTYFDNPGVNLPSSITTWVAMKAMPDFLQRLREATKNYRLYCQEEGVSKACIIIKEEERIREEQRLRDQLDYCSFSLKRKEKVRLEENSPKANIERRKSSKEPYDLQSGKVSRNFDGNSSDTNPTAPSATVKSNHSSFWKYINLYYYFQ